MTNWPLEAERQLLSAACRDSFELFARTALGFTHPKNRKGRWWTDSVHKPLCAWLEREMRDWLASRHKASDRRYLAVLIPRNCAKSLLVTRAAMLWLHLQDPNLSTFIGNEKLELAEDFLRTIKRWLEGSADKHCLFTWLYGTWKGDNNRWRSDSIIHSGRTTERSEPSFGIWSPSSALTGRHPDVICMDDLVSYDALRKDVNWFEHAYAHMTDLIPVIEPNGLVILVGTRYSDADPFGRCFKADGIESLDGHTNFPEYKPRPRGRWRVYFLSGRDRDTGTPTIPAVWSEREMQFYELRDPIKFAAQVLNRPRAHKLRAMTEAQFDRCVTSDIPKKAILVIHLDTAFKSTKKLASGSETALVVNAHHLDEPGRLTTLEAISGINYRAETFAALVVEQYKRWSQTHIVSAITDEAEMAGKAGLWEQYLRDYFTDHDLEFPAFHCFQRQTGEKKEVRIADAIHFVVNGQVKFHQDCGSLAALRDQIANHPDAFPNDLADCWADSFNPEFFSGLLLKLKAEAETYPYGAYEERLKGRLRIPHDIMGDMEFDRPPIRRSALRPEASSDRSPFAEQGAAPPSFFF